MFLFNMSSVTLYGHELVVELAATHDRGIGAMNINHEH